MSDDPKYIISAPWDRRRIWDLEQRLRVVEAERDAEREARERAEAALRPLAQIGEAIRKAHMSRFEEDCVPVVARLLLDADAALSRTAQPEGE